MLWSYVSNKHDPYYEPGIHTMVCVYVCVYIIRSAYKGSFSNMTRIIIFKTSKIVVAEPPRGQENGRKWLKLVSRSQIRRSY